MSKSFWWRARLQSTPATILRSAPAIAECEHVLIGYGMSESEARTFCEYLRTVIYREHSEYVTRGVIDILTRKKR